MQSVRAWQLVELTLQQVLAMRHNIANLMTEMKALLNMQLESDTVDSTGKCSPITILCYNSSLSTFHN